MSAIYNLEPQPTGSVILHTTQGDLAVELWAKQTPLTCRNFLQLALDGYYDNTIFHRLVPGFILQGGDPTGTGSGGESIYDGGALSGELDPWPLDQRRGQNAGPSGVGFKDEFHSRLKFNRRGLLGMANEGRPDTNGSQFFFTLDKAEELTNKNTLFGRIAGDTIYNLAKMGEAEVTAGTDRPMYPVKITSVEILVNPFEDMQKRQRIAHQGPKTVVVERKKKRKVGGKQLLSFGDEEGDAEIVTPALKKPKFDTRIVMDVEDGVAPSREDKERQKAESREKKTKEETKNTTTGSAPPPSPPGTNGKEEKRREPSPQPRVKASRPPREEVESSPEPERATQKSALERTKEEIAALKASMRRAGDATAPVREEKKKRNPLEEMIPETSIRGRKRRTGGGGHAPTKEDLSALELLKAFQSKLEQGPPAEKKEDERRRTTGEKEKGDEEEEGSKQREDQGAGEEAELCDLHFIAGCQSCKAWDQAEKGEESDDEGWMSHALSFKADKLGKDLSYRKKAEEELMVIDPREKARTLKEEKRAGREARMGNTGREWDQARNAKMASTAALAGRGAK
ncbi:cyclophilin-like protein [Sodiomyces alkalinus F11]|uniref:peptidylprolyl isomerase n=1 Tax=Sodiomyces alkalinus (strain CBS 110278 / VKM F-3762 / F11) TaxID=1314773 RepID=A0A3N2Q9A4_SODAK|nr:cyclophilin-like protein [Sodiomyces alkalinus F11]ROT43306.1 cyclophilin-like protein [Sodiomyces alkalinus F11]